MAHQGAVGSTQVVDDAPAREVAVQKYQRWTRASRLALAAFVALGSLTLVWLVPWLPIGMDTNSYSPEVAFSVFLLGGFAAAGILVFAFRWSAQRQMERLAAWTELSRSLDELTMAGVTSGQNE